MSDGVKERLDALETRLGRLETLLEALNDNPDRSSSGLAESKARWNIRSKASRR